MECKSFSSLGKFMNTLYIMQCTEVFSKVQLTKSISLQHFANNMGVPLSKEGKHLNY